jgi:hypothetical protein
MALGILYMALTVCAGVFFYWLRNNHRILYGTSEILAALASMYFIYLPHGGPVLLYRRTRATRSSRIVGVMKNGRAGEARPSPISTHWQA